MKPTRTTLALVATLALLFACQPPTSEAPAAPPAEEGNIIISPNAETDMAILEAYLDAMISGDESGMRSNIAPGFMSYFQTYPGDSSTIDELVEDWAVTIRQSRTNQAIESTAMSSLRVKSGNLAGDWVLYWGVYTATDNETGADMVVPFHTTNLMQNGKIFRQFTYYDGRGISEQLGYELVKKE